MSKKGSRVGSRLGELELNSLGKSMFESRLKETRPRKYQESEAS